MPDTATTVRPLPATDHVPRPYSGPTREEVLAQRRRHVHPSLFTLYDDPLMLVEGHMQYVWDERGTRYLDLFAGIVTVSCGHAHPRVVQAMTEQLERLGHTTTIYLHPNLGQAAEALASRLPDGLDTVYFVNSGSEANELAVNMARVFTGNTDVIAVRNSYHGMSSSSMGLTSHHTWKHDIPQGHRIHHARSPEPYRNSFPGTPEEQAHLAAEDIRELIRYSTPGQVAAFFAEPIQGVGGVTQGAPNYLGEAYAVVREHGGLCIADEVQTGFGRTGSHYWGFQNYDVTPDMVVMAKGLGNGAPVAAVVTRREIADAFTGPLHFNTYGGNPVSMAAVLAVLDVIDADGLQENARVVGGRLKAGLEALQERHAVIGDVRGMGLMLGVELVSDRAAQTPDKEATARVLESAREHGLLLGKGGLFGNVLRIKPPMCLTTEDVDFALDVLDLAFAEAA